ncbi:MAG: VCBS repeat-containing protein, partial [Phaeodactylibacter sp.]|nr:VCBS repeat-containing protein [Phaeodactylibacter sp.]
RHFLFAPFKCVIKIRQDGDPIIGGHLFSPELRQAHHDFLEGCCERRACHGLEFSFNSRRRHWWAMRGAPASMSPHILGRGHSRLLFRGHFWTEFGFEFALFDGDSLPDGIGVIAISNVDWQPVIWNSSTGDTLSFPQFEIRENNHFDVADADGDGDQDIVLLTRNNGVVILWNEWNSGGSITAETVIPDLSASYIYTGILMDDFDQDGDGDLVIRLNSGTFFARHLNGNGQFNDLEEIEGIFGVDVLFSGDYDLDGRLDLRGRSVIQGLDGIILISSYDTVQQAFTPVLERGTVGKTFGLVETLINSDSIPDYVNRGGFSFNVGATGFVSTPFVPAPFENYLPQSLYQNACWADLDGDGTEELITGSQEVMLYQPAFSSQQLVQGQMVWDTTQNCTFDSGLPGLPDGELLLQGQDSVQQILTTTPSGYYAGYLPDTIAQILTPVLPNGYWEACPSDTVLQGTGPHEVNFAIAPTVLCPLMELDMALSPIRECFNSTVVLHYNNAGTETADSVQVQLFFDSRM